MSTPTWHVPKTWLLPGDLYDHPDQHRETARDLAELNRRIESLEREVADLRRRVSNGADK